MEIDYAAMSNAEWFAHCTERWNYWEDVLIREPRHTSAGFLVAAFQRQRMIAYGKMTPAERARLA